MSKFEVGALAVLLVLITLVTWNWLKTENVMSLEEAILWCQENGGVLKSDHACEVSGSMTWKEINESSSD